MSLINSLKTARQETRISTMFPITHLNSPSIFESHHGYLGSTLKIEGIPFLLADEDYLNQMSYRLHQALLTLDERFIQYVTVHRRKEETNLGGEFKSSFAKRVNDKYHARFKGKNLYRNDIYLTTVLKGDTSSKIAKSLSFLEKLKESKFKEEKAKRREDNLIALNTKVEQLKTSLSAFTPYQLGEKDGIKGYSELLEFLSIVINGGEKIQFKKPIACPPSSKHLAKALLPELIYPHGHIGHYLSKNQIFFGECIQFQGANKSDTRFAAVLSIKQYCEETGSVIFDPLLELDCEYVLTHSFAPIPREVALDIIKKKRSKMLSANDLGRSQIEDLEKLEDSITSSLSLLGYHHHSLMLLASTKEELEKAIRQAVKAYQLSGTVIIKETIGAEPAFWAQIPTNHHFITRATPITSHNFTDLCSLHNYETGFYDENHLGQAVTLLETPSKTPVYFNYHSKSSKTNPAKGHTAIFGATNAGKNTLVAFLDAQMGRYNNRSFFLDRDEASKIYVLSAENSSYTVISPEFANKIQMNPLQLPDSPKNRTFIKEWFAELIKHPDEADLPSEIRETINECVNYSFEHLEKRYRNLSNIARCLPKDFPRWPELRRWLRASEQFEKGEYAWIFDNDGDGLNFHFDKVGFDITYLIDEVSPLISTPVYLYLLHRMRQCLDGRLTSFIIDEAWQVFASLFWLKHLKSWAATIRKKNGHFIFMTQSPESVINSPIASEIITNVATTIYFPNPTANEIVFKERLGLSEVEYQTIKKITPESRLFLYKQDKKSILCKLDLKDLSDEIRVLSANQSSVRLLDSLIEEVGTNPNDWLPLFLQRSAL
ncbi:VirB4 family type IV secretion/conjugal transfer ATPase [Tatlockia micdadei]|uniref:VirB4 family type IV secretion/conjugal transfer ATPase n=1 Tax=Legionella micdadei TaxID=451 RepID=UPI00156F166D|nr:VirB4 family type IV secretion/conjugal transfer ATPase [Legionella micdadei]NSL19581.1 VirB4 family type IV secretion/conjugal transfer ATPase [Legionella micdadei]